MTPEQSLRTEASLLQLYGLDEMADTLLNSLAIEDWSELHTLADNIEILDEPKSKHRYPTIMANIIRNAVYELENKTNEL